MPAHSFSTRVCALRDIEITTLIDDYREIAEFPSAALTRAAFQQVRARRLCKNAKVIRSLLIYDAMERDLGRIEERLNARDSGYQRVRRPYP